jgi:FkbM family methyltransferase
MALLLPDSVARAGLKRWLRLGLEKQPGGWRIAQMLAQGQGAAPIQMQGLAPVYVDLRSFDLLEISLFLAAPNEPEFERDDRAIFRAVVRPGDVVFDIGANIGYHLALFSSLAGEAGTVYGFEPQPMLLPNLRRTVNGLPNTRLLEYALSDEPGEVTFHIPDHGYHMLASMGDPGVASRKVACKASRLDDLWISHEIPLPDFIKIDVEGAEPLVFRGGEQMLNRDDAPIIFFEQWQDAARRIGFSGTAAADYLCSLKRPDFLLFEASGTKLLPLNSNNVEKGNLLAVPKSRRSRLR